MYTRLAEISKIDFRRFPDAICDMRFFLAIFKCYLVNFLQDTVRFRKRIDTLAYRYF